MKILRLLLFEDCNRKCEGCCNKDWDLKNLPVATSFTEYDEILLTGGEPLLDWRYVVKVAQKIKSENSAKVFVYTAKVDNLTNVIIILDNIDGLTVTLHEQSDVIPFRVLETYLKSNFKTGKSFRLNVFRGVDVEWDEEIWKVKDDIVWAENCPLPKNEEFKRAEIKRIKP